MNNKNKALNINTQQLLRLLSRNYEKQNILEIGCGQGFNAHLLSKNSKNTVTAIDLSPDEIRVSKHRYPEISFLVMNAENLKFRSASFDKVYALEVLEHIDNLDKVLSEISRVLRPNGKLIVSVPCYKSEKWLIKVRPSYFKEIHHVRIFKKNELDKMLVSKGFILHKKSKKGFLQHVELYFLFKRKNELNSQTSIGSWRDNIWTKSLHAFMLYFDPLVLKTPLVYLPVWVVTIPAGALINNIGNQFLPKSFYYEFIKK